jgi:hypothetical protein
MPTFVGLKLNSPTEIISSKNFRTAMIWILNNTTTKTSAWPHDQGHHCLRKVKLRQDKNRLRVKIKIYKKFIVLSFLYVESISFPEPAIAGSGNEIDVESAKVEITD